MSRRASAAVPDVCPYIAARTAIFATGRSQPQRGGDVGVEVVGRGSAGEVAVARDGRQHTGFDLPEVGADEQVARLGHHRGPQLARHRVQAGGGGHPPGAAVAARPGAAQPAVGAEVVVEPAVAVGGGDPLALAPLQQGVDERVGAGQLLQPPRPGVRQVESVAAQQVLHLQRAAQVDGGVVGHGVEHDAVAPRPDPALVGLVGRAAAGHLADQPLGLAPGRRGDRWRRARPPPGRPRTRRTRRAGRCRVPGPPRTSSSWRPATSRARAAQRRARCGVLPQAPDAQSGRRWPSGRTGSSGRPSSSDDGAAAPQADASAPRRSSCPERGAAETSSPRTWHHTSAGSARCPPCSTRCTAARSQQRPSRRSGSTASNGRQHGRRRPPGPPRRRLGIEPGELRGRLGQRHEGAGAVGAHQRHRPAPQRERHLLAGAQPLDHQVVRVAQASQRSRHAIAAGYASRRLVRLASPWPSSA